MNAAPIIVKRGKFAPEVSDHALVRWLERVHGIDMKRLRREILKDQDLRNYLSCAATSIKQGRVEYCASKGKIITIKIKGERK